MTWTIGKLGSRFSLVFEPYKKRVLHSALGRFLDQPLDLMVGLIEPDGTYRVLPFTADYTPLFNCEQFERLNSITFRGFSEKYNLRFEFNIHSVFYPQMEKLCIMPAFYLEMRVNPLDQVRRFEPAGPTPKNVTLFLRLRRPDTQIHAQCVGEQSKPATINLSYRNPLELKESFNADRYREEEIRSVQVNEQIASINPNCRCLETGDGLCLDIPVSASGSGIKWRLVWAAHVNEPVLKIKSAAPETTGPGTAADQFATVHDADFRYCRYWNNVNEVIDEAILTRDEYLGYSRRFEKIFEQAPIEIAQRHLLNQSFQNWLINTWWCDLMLAGGGKQEWFSVMEGSNAYHSTLDVEYNNVLLYLTIWPQLLVMQMRQWSSFAEKHPQSGGCFLPHDLGNGIHITGQQYPHPMEVEENSNFLIMLQAYTHWTGDKKSASELAGLIVSLADYLVWTDHDHSGFPSAGMANTADDACPAMQYSRKQTYLAIKRLAAIRAASDLLALIGQQKEKEAAYSRLVEQSIEKIEQKAWLGDHYAVSADNSAVGLVNLWTNEPLPYETLPAWDAYSIYTSNALLLPTIIGQPSLINTDRLKLDMVNTIRENFYRYGCGHTSVEMENIRISQNFWRDHLANYLRVPDPGSQGYWDMQVMSNTHEQSLGFADSYINNNLAFHPRGICIIGCILSSSRLIIDRLAAGGTYITVEPNRHAPQRWPLLALADWKAGKIPVCVVTGDGKVAIEGQNDPVIIHGEDVSKEKDTKKAMIG